MLAYFSDGLPGSGKRKRREGRGIPRYLKEFIYDVKTQVSEDPHERDHKQFRFARDGKSP
jgi:hypothetical protein